MLYLQYLVTMEFIKENLSSFWKYTDSFCEKYLKASKEHQ
jgi:hypothetical protein